MPIFQFLGKNWQNKYWIGPIGFYGIFGKFKFIFYGNLVLPGSLLGVKLAIYQIMLNSHKSNKFFKESEIFGHFSLFFALIW